MCNVDHRDKVNLFIHMGKMDTKITLHFFFFFFRHALAALEVGVHPLSPEGILVV